MGNLSRWGPAQGHGAGPASDSSRSPRSSWPLLHREVVSDLPFWTSISKCEETHCCLHGPSCCCHSSPSTFPTDGQRAGHRGEGRHIGGKPPTCSDQDQGSNLQPSYMLDQESNPRPFSSRADALTTEPPAGARCWLCITDSPAHVRDSDRLLRALGVLCMEGRVLGSVALLLPFILGPSLSLPLTAAGGRQLPALHAALTSAIRCSLPQIPQTWTPRHTNGTGTGLRVAR